MNSKSSENAVMDAARWTGVRRRRWFFWGLVVVYMPAIATALHFTESMQVAGILFLSWAILLIIAVCLVATAKCPACANNFYMRNGSLSFSARCRHCGLVVRGEPGRE
ncbi:hypothetical protein [Geomonas sp.]|uniref:hypothetical protein n=1 Tax=Geomonas sp. TaxID=2651584 RepID=UPI002B485C0B|nr:hypothetical protein [Geomonas sp.]HJV35261.1 hypothetical protein [Geomonas sp.]